MKLKSEEFAIVRDAMGTLEGRQTGYIVAYMSSADGIADTGLKQGYTSLGWIVMVSEDMREVTAPVRAIGRFALLMVIFSSLMVTLLAVYYFLHGKQQFADIKGAISD
jgi:hypothetical protein